MAAHSIGVTWSASLYWHGCFKNTTVAADTAEEDNTTVEVQWSGTPVSHHSWPFPPFSMITKLLWFPQGPAGGALLNTSHSPPGSLWERLERQLGPENHLWMGSWVGIAQPGPWFCGRASLKLVIACLVPILPLCDSHSFCHWFHAPQEHKSCWHQHSSPSLACPAAVTLCFLG